MNPKAVLIIRHAEKPQPAEGLPGLSAQGRIRAAALPSLFYGLGNNQPAHARFPRPHALFATRATERSNRPAETLVPLARALSLPIDDSYGREEHRRLATQIRSGNHADRIVLVSWHRRGMQELALSLGVNDAPAWPETLFDRIWKIEWSTGAAAFESLPQNLLPGDDTA
jgi:hypothetical protein